MAEKLITNEPDVESESRIAQVKSQMLSNSNPNFTEFWNECAAHVRSAFEQIFEFEQFSSAPSSPRPPEETVTPAPPKPLHPIL